jgi:hypothetical protein
MGLRDRLECEAEFIEPRIRGKNKISVRRDAAANWRYFQQKGVNLVVRLTDSGIDRWQDVKREETRHFPEQMRSILICGVTSGDVEFWLACDRQYLETQLGIPASREMPASELVGTIKGAISRHPQFPDCAEVVRHFVLSAPAGVFRNWLKDPSLGDLYQECRDAALREEDCPVADEPPG